MITSFPAPFRPAGPAPTTATQAQRLRRVEHYWNWRRAPAALRATFFRRPALVSWHVERQLAALIRLVEHLYPMSLCLFLNLEQRLQLPIVRGLFLGDGDGYGIGMGHFIHAMRRNLNVTYIVMDNEVYGLTTGQASPTTLEGHKTKSTPRGNVEKPVQPLALALVTGATYVARGFSGEQKHLTGLVRDAIAHRGFSLIDVFSPCITFNMLNTYPWFKERIYKLEENGGYDSTDLMAAIGKSLEFGSRIPIGCLYKIDKPIYDDSEPVLQRGPLVDQPLGLDRETFDEILAETM